MSITEIWGTSGTSGHYGWTFANVDSVTIANQDGTKVLELDGTNLAAEGYDGIGTALFPYSLTHCGVGSFSARQFTTYLTTSDKTQTSYLMAVNDGGTALYIEPHFWSSVSNAFYEYYDGTVTKLNGTQVTTSIGGTNYWADIECVESSGTLYGTLTVDGTAVNAVAAGWTFSNNLTPMVIDRSEINEITHLDFVTYPYTHTTILDFIGTYDDGSSTGTYCLGDDVLTMGGVSEVGFIPYVSQGWAATIPVTVDDTGSAWSDLCGGMSNPTFLEGTFFVRQQWNGTWHTLRTCYIGAEDIQYDYGKKIASVTLHDILGRYADKTFPMDGTALLVQQAIFGTVLSAGGGTVSVESTINHDNVSDAVQFHEGDTIWAGFGTDGDRIKIGSAFRYDEYGQGSWTDSYHGTFATTGSVPSWITDMVAGGEVLYITTSWPTSYDVSTYDKPSTVVKSILGEWGLGGQTRQSYQYMDYWSISWGKRYYGGDKYKDALNDVCAGCMSSYTLDGNGAPTFYSDGPWTGSNLGTVDFNDGVGNDWTVGYVPATKQVRVNAGWSEEDRKFTVEYLSESGTYSSGKVLTIDAGWVRDNIDTEYMADRVALQRGITRTVLSLPINGSRWLDYSPRYMYAILNIPASVPVVNNQWRLMGKTYNHKSDITTLTFESKRANSDWFTWTKSVWGGTDVWW